MLTSKRNCGDYSSSKALGEEEEVLAGVSSSAIDEGEPHTNTVEASSLSMKLFCQNSILTSLVQA